MAEQYGFFTEEYDNGASVETLMTGDGKSQFCDAIFDDGTASITIGYGRGKGIGTKEDHDGLLTSDLGAKWQVKFERQESVDAMIETLLRVKNQLANADKKSGQEG